MYSLFKVALINYACDLRQRNLKLHYHPIRGESKCTYDLFARVFPYLARFVCLLSALSLVHVSICHVVVIDRSNFFDPVFAMQHLSWKRVESQQDLQLQNRGNELPWTSLRIMGNASIFIVRVARGYFRLCMCSQSISIPLSISTRLPTD